MNNATISMDTGPESYCVPGASDFQGVYKDLHGYIAIAICILGSIANIVNIAVLSRKEMASNTNYILTGLAAADLLVMLEYIPLALHMYIPLGPPMSDNSYAWAVFIYFHSIFSLTFHTISIWLTITLAVWRFAAIKFPHRNKTWFTKRNTAIVIVGAYFICPFTCLPIVFAMNIIAVREPNSTNVDYILTMNSSKRFVTTIFWIYSVLLKLIPCIVLSVFMACLISIMNKSEKRRQKLMQKKNIKATNEEKTSLQKEEGVKKAVLVGRTDRTTRMLVTLLGLFLITELPQGLFGLLSALAPHFFEKCYIMFAEVMDILALLSSAINFVLYCSMSKQFRTTFARLISDLLEAVRRRVRGGCYSSFHLLSLLTSRPLIPQGYRKR